MTKNLPGKIKVCFVAPKAYPIFNPEKGDYFGGAEVDLYCLATEFARDGNFEVSFIVADYGQKDVEIIEDVTVIKSLDFRSNVLDGLLRTWSALTRIFVYRTAHLYECDGTFLRTNPLLGRAFAWSLRRADVVFVQNATDVEHLKRTVGVSSHVIANGHRLPELGRLPRQVR